MGTTETIACGPTSSPWSGDHMAGGSSGGSGAAVGAGHRADRDRLGRRRVDQDPRVRLRGGGPEDLAGSCHLGAGRGRAAAGLGRALRADPLAARHRRLPGRAGRAVSRRALHAGRTARWRLARPAAPAAGPLRIAVCWQPWSGAEVVAEIRAACEATATLLAGLGHEPVEASPQFSWEQFLDAMTVIWSSTTAHTVDGFAQAVGREPSPDNLELPTFRMVEFGRAVKVGELLNAIDSAGYVEPAGARLLPGLRPAADPHAGSAARQARHLQAGRGARAEAAVRRVGASGVVPAGVQRHPASRPSACRCT